LEGLRAATDTDKELQTANADLKARIKDLTSARSAVGSSTTSDAAAGRAQPAAPPTTSADRRAIAIATVFALAAPFVLFGFGATFRVMGWSFFTFSRAAETGLIMAGVFVLAVAAVCVGWRRATLGGVESALYWLGCGVAWTIAAGALFYCMRWTVLGSSYYGESGVLFGCLCALASAAIMIRRRKEPLAGAEVALYWFGCALAIAAALAVLVHTAGWRDPSLFLVSAVAVIVTAAIVVWRRWAVLEGGEMALYWGGSSLAVAVAAAALSDRLGWYITYGVASCLVLASGTILIRRRKTPLGAVEAAIYWFGLSVAGAVLTALVLHQLRIIAFHSPASFGLGLAVVVLSGAAVVVLRRRRTAKA